MPESLPRLWAFKLEEIRQWQCCGGVYPLGKDEIATKLSAVRALKEARDQGTGSGYPLFCLSSCDQTGQR